jgi:D-alanyl-D-alanine carboxypeptidase
MDFDSGEVLASANPDEPLPPASLTKMMTSFLVEQALRSGKLKKTTWSRSARTPGAGARAPSRACTCR